MQIFYSSLIENDFLILSEEESKHAIKVLRLVSGDKIVMVNGLGTRCIAVITEAHAKRCAVSIIEREISFEPRKGYLHILIAPTKNSERLEWFLEKATEIGIDEITPIVCEHSERVNLNYERLNRVLISAMKQSQKAYLPRLNELKKVHELFPILTNKNIPVYLAHCAESPNKKWLKDLHQAASGAIIMIGPEGDFSVKEIEMAKANNIQEISLSVSRLRTETAALMACATINMLNGE